MTKRTISWFFEEYLAVEFIAQKRADPLLQELCLCCGFWSFHACQ